MGSPVGPLAAEFFMTHLENKMVKNCPPEFKPSYYRRFVDDCFAVFNNSSQATMFLSYINSLHPNIKFTMEIENNSCLSFLDLNINKSIEGISTSVHRKQTHGGLGLNFFSFCDLSYKLSAINTLLYRAYHLSSSYFNIHTEFEFLKRYFTDNGYPICLVEKQISKFLSLVFKPRFPNFDVPKDIKYFIAPDMGPLNSEFRRKISKLLKSVYLHTNFRISFINNKSISSFFSLKDKLPRELASGVVYQFTCPRCSCGTYIGSTVRSLRVRFCSHMGISHRTDKLLKTKEPSAIRSHAIACKADITLEDFSIIDRHNNETSLRILESIHIKKRRPTLNNDSSAYPLQIL